MAAADITVRLRTARQCCLTLFYILGLNIGCWVSAMPGLKRGFGLNAGQLGLAIMCSGIASLGMALPAGRLVDYLGCRMVSMTSGICGPLAYSCLPLLAKAGVAPYFPLFLLNVISAGGFISCNARASELEQVWGRPIMASFHAAFSLGGLTGSAAYAGLLARGFDWPTAYPMTCLVTCTGCAIACLFMDTGLKPYSRPVTYSSSGSMCAWSPSPLVLGLGIMAALAMLTEGAVGDWFALYLQEYDGTTYAAAPLGYACFAAAMCISRAIGDSVAYVSGRQVVYRGSAMLVLLGLSGFLWSKETRWALFFCAIIGTGCANIMPILISVAARTAPRNAGVCIAAVSSLGNAGLLAGPAVIGFLAQYQGLRRGLTLLLCNTCILMLTSGLVSEPDSRRRSYTEAFDHQLQQSILDRYAVESPCSETRPLV
eukprot:Protomagalhaensia_sp_Gyna_25__1449@NODE_1733_length_1578_cov_63_758934_g1422_i0_p1_GENE_NODE_1733_length_1578_cov_63_758934_g1422_i0NODE_1733_length_1578_cov_63_758934_g1422_i0_p1_ORF_typecomplete_len459_score39_51MFS_1/PF07690_16/1e17MFS_1/PF07690_16/4_3e08MFS_3/PF05977_13/0_0015MFS_3/PF05977_13/6_7e07MFS_2/PF13347_6/1_4MFS_2/PF13347_6/1_9e07MFS_4/PF06779_14/1_1e02MFS_4/PF06779_14/0_02_NODE_1733_length_1578_cov_63_758934_g1422_i02021485